MQRSACHICDEERPAIGRGIEEQLDDESDVILIVNRQVITQFREAPVGTQKTAQAAAIEGMRLPVENGLHEVIVVVYAV